MSILTDEKDYHNNAHYVTIINFLDVNFQFSLKCFPRVKKAQTSEKSTNFRKRRKKMLSCFNPCLSPIWTNPTVGFIFFY